MGIFQYAKENSAPKEKLPVSNDNSLRSYSSIFKYAKENPSIPTHKEHEAGFEDEEEGLLSKIGRGAVRTGRRVGEVVSGTPGNILSLANIPAKFLVEQFGGKGVPYEEMGISKVLPTSEQLKATSSEKELPHTKGEKSFDEFVEDLTSLATPTGPVKALKTGAWAAKAAIAGLGIGAKEGAKSIGLKEDYADLAKIGTLMGAQLAKGAGWKGADKHVSKLYQEARSARPIDASVSSKGMQKNIEKSLIDLGKGSSSDPSKQKAFSLLREIKDKSSVGSIPVEELEAFKRSLNESRSNLYTDAAMSRAATRKAQKNLNMVDKVLENGIEEYGKKNPKYYKAYKEANSAYGAIEQSKKASRFLQRLHPVKSTAGAVAGEILLGHPEAIPATLGIAAAGTSLTKLFEVAMRSKNPVLRKYYFGIMKGAMEENAHVVNRNLLKMKKEMGD